MWTLSKHQLLMEIMVELDLVDTWWHLTPQGKGFLLSSLLAVNRSWICHCYPEQIRMSGCNIEPIIIIFLFFINNKK